MSQKEWSSLCPSTSPRLHHINYTLQILYWETFSYLVAWNKNSRDLFESPEGLLDAVMTILSHIPHKTLLVTFHKWMAMLQFYIDTNREYVE
jgi:hypothetical protein